MASTKSKQRIFITGATGYIGSVITEFATAQGHEVRGLSRNENGDAKLEKLGATPIRGDLHTLDTLRSESANADIVLHLADSFLDRGNPRPYEEVIRTDGAAVDALAEPLKGTNKPLVVTSGTLTVASDLNGEETDENSPLEPTPFVERIRSEKYALSFVEQGVKVIAVRLSPFVYGRGGSGISMFLATAHQDKQSIYVDDGRWRTSAVHVDDAARLYLLAALNGQAGDVFNATSSTNTTIRQIAAAMAILLDVRAVSLSREEAEAKMGPIFSRFLTSENRASSGKAKKVLGWEPREPGLLEEITTGSYKQTAQDLREGSV